MPMIWVILGAVVVVAHVGADHFPVASLNE